jgi:hypothetical protein
LQIDFPYYVFGSRVNSFQRLPDQHGVGQLVVRGPGIASGVKGDWIATGDKVQMTSGKIEPL